MTKLIEKQYTRTTLEKQVNTFLELSKAIDLHRETEYVCTSCNKLLKSVFDASSYVFGSVKNEAAEGDITRNLELCL